MNENNGRRRGSWLSALCMLLSAGCSSRSAPDPPCVTVTTACAPEYQPVTFDAIYTKTFAPTCATGRGTCHTADAKMGGFAFTSADDGYAALVGGGRVVPNDPSCSLLMKRLASKDPSFHMPPGSESIQAGETCAIVQWISAGAPR